MGPPGDVLRRTGRGRSRYANENDGAGPAETRLIYGDAKVARLAALKRVWDQDNVFRLNHNVAPAADRAKANLARDSARSSCGSC
ncbi:MAG: BBE domain-containing protein [Candidatus Limnocylindrales bacterium]